MKHRDLSNGHYLQMKTLLRGADMWDEDTMWVYRRNALWASLRAWWRLPGYKALWACAGLESILDLEEAVGDLRVSPEEVLSHLPCLTREMLRDDRDAFSFAAQPGANRWPKASGGSSGVPISVWYNEASFGKELGAKAHLYGRVGWREGDAQMTMRGVRVGTASHTEWVPSLHELRCSSFYLTSEWLERYYAEALEHNVQWLRCYPSSGYVLANWLLSQNKMLPLTGVLCASEKLYDFQKSVMEDAFDCRIFSHYGNVELAALAGYCECADTYHVLQPYGVAELLDADLCPVTEIGAVGEIVGTSFIATGTPMVRYRTGDLATYGGEECFQCARKGPIWLDIEGRTGEFLEASNGRIISPSALNDHGDLYAELLQFRYTQTEKGKVIFSFVPRYEIDAMSLGYRVMDSLGEGFELRMKMVQSLPPTPSGKRGFFVKEE